MGYGFRTAGARAGWKFDIQGRERAYSLNDWNELPERIIYAAERLKCVQIECKPAVDVIGRFDFENVLRPAISVGDTIRKTVQAGNDKAAARGITGCIAEKQGEGFTQRIRKRPLQ